VSSREKEVRSCISLVIIDGFNGALVSSREKGAQRDLTVRE
jgi:hypothetical protein